MLRARLCVCVCAYVQCTCVCVCRRRQRYLKLSLVPTYLHLQIYAASAYCTLLKHIHNLIRLAGIFIAVEKKRKKKKRMGERKTDSNSNKSTQHFSFHEMNKFRLVFFTILFLFYFS